MPAVYGCTTTSIPAHSLSWDSTTFTIAVFKGMIQKTWRTGLWNRGEFLWSLNLVTYKGQSRMSNSLRELLSCKGTGRETVAKSSKSTTQRSHLRMPLNTQSEFISELRITKGKHYLSCYKNSSKIQYTGMPFDVNKMKEQYNRKLVHFNLKYKGEAV